MILFFLFQFILSSHAQNVLNGNDLDRITSPYAVGSTLHIKGKIDSHIYDYLSYAGESLHAIKWVSLNSFGGNHDWAMAIAQKLQALKHGARLGLQHRIEFLQKCAGFAPTEFNLPGDCEQILSAWYKVSYDATADAFLWMQAQGASQELFNIYMDFENVDEWLEAGNVLRKPDWVIPARDALSLSLATDLF